MTPRELHELLAWLDRWGEAALHSRPEQWQSLNKRAESVALTRARYRVRWEILQARDLLLRMGVKILMRELRAHLHELEKVVEAQVQLWVDVPRKDANHGSQD